MEYEKSLINKLHEFQGTMNKDIITIGGVQYEYIGGQYTSGENACEHCALNGICNKGSYNSIICKITKHLDDFSGNFQPMKAEPQPEHSRLLDEDTYKTLQRLGILDTSVRAYNRGTSDYSQHIIQPWAIWQEYNLNPWDADIVKRILRTKQGDSRRLDYEKIIHICEERIRQIDTED